jgi:hypothetical protein
MIFQGSNHSYSNFFYKNLSLAEVKEYNFLGNIIDNKGRFKRSVYQISLLWSIIGLIKESNNLQDNTTGTCTSSDKYFFNEENAFSPF